MLACARSWLEATLFRTVPTLSTHLCPALGRGLVVSWGLQAQGVALCSSPVRGLLLVLRGPGWGLRALLCMGSAQALREEPGQGRPAAFCPISSWAVLLLGEAPGDGLPACAPFPVGSPRGAHCLGMDGLLSVAMHLLVWALPVFPGPP